MSPTKGIFGELAPRTFVGFSLHHSSIKNHIEHLVYRNAVLIHPLDQVWPESDGLGMNVISNLFN